jgi:tripartite-type tricarboxylate transporter receptor subunit TctC
MRMPQRLSILATLGALCITASSVAQTYPVRPIRLIAPFPAGNAADVVSRSMVDRLSQRLGQQVIVDNRVGGGGTIGVDAVAKAPPDGYTLLVTSLSPVALLPAVYKKLPYDVEKDLVPVSLIGFTAMILVTHPSIPANNVTELIAFLKANPGKHNYAHLGAGTISHLSMETMKSVAGVDVVGIPYKGSGQAYTDLLGGQITLLFDGMTSATSQVKAGKVKGIAVTSAERSPFLPNVATLGDELSALNLVAWIGMFAPPGTPRAIVDRWHKEIVETTAFADVRERLGNVSVQAGPSESPEKFAEFHRVELAKWAKIARGAGVYQSQ